MADDSIDTELDSSDNSRNQLISTQNNDDLFDQIKYDQLLYDSIKKARIAIFVALSVPFTGTTRYFIMQPYMLSISSLTTFEVSSIIFCGFIWYALVTFITTQFSDHYDYDKILLFSFIFASIGLFLEAISTNIIIFSIGYFVASISILSVVIAYITSILPHKHTKRCTSELSSFSFVIYLIGPIVSGFISDYISFRSVFWLNVIISIMDTLIIFGFIYGSQNELQNQQKKLTKNYVQQQKEENMFPVCVNINNDDDSDNISWKSLISKIEKYTLVVLLISLIQNGLCWTIKGIFIFYYSLLIISRFNTESFLNAACMLSLVSMFFGGSTFLLPKLIKRIIPKYVYVISVASVGMIIIQAICAFKSNTEITYWIATSILGILLGIISMGTEMCVLEMLPNQYSGKVSGFGYSLRIILRAIGILFVGAFWIEPLCNSFWMVMVGCSTLITILSLLMFYLTGLLPDNSTI